MTHSIFDTHSHAGVCAYCQVHTRVIYMTDMEGTDEDLEVCGPCYREGKVPDVYGASIGCLDCREHDAMFGVGDKRP
jgi:hypothetical protein